ncbi:MAG: hypothetical protein ABIK28_06480 [Planctomycetota bacterium]
MVVTDEYPKGVSGKGTLNPGSITAEKVETKQLRLNVESYDRIRIFPVSHFSLSSVTEVRSQSQEIPVAQARIRPGL